MMRPTAKLVAITVLVAAAAGEMTQVSIGSGNDDDRYGLTGVDPLNLKLVELTSSKAAAPVAEVQRLLEDGASPSSHGEYNYSALMWSIVRQRPDYVKALLEAGADTEFTNAWGRNAIFLAAWEGLPSVMELLIIHGVNVHAAAAHDGFTALHKASEMSHKPVVRSSSPRVLSCVWVPCDRHVVVRAWLRRRAFLTAW